MIIFFNYTNFYKLESIFMIMTYNIFLGIVEKPEALDYPLKYMPVFGFSEEQLSDGLTGWTKYGFNVIYQGETETPDEVSARGIATNVNNILAKANKQCSLDILLLNDLFPK
ncbi:MAG: hypothetical protein QT09_C0004G0085 [archaeon GW2011_AR18]|nr:MAG: hypothetical protein QT09_C0004G0085 [archaeon GW2011_AR18]